MARGDDLSVSVATLADAATIVALRTSVARDLTRRHGRGHWSSCPTERGVLRGLTLSRVLVARRGDEPLGTLGVEAKKPWAIDPRYFMPVSRAVYLHDLAVAPRAQGQGVGRRLMEEAKVVARAWPSQAIRLDAYDHAAGAGPFYEKCGFREVGRVAYRGIPLVYFELLF